MTARTGLYVARDASNNGTTPQGARLAQSGLIEWAGPNPLDTKQGVFYDTGTPVVAGTAGMSYDVRAFVATGRLSAASGPWISANDATVNVVTTAAPGSNSRIDVIWCRQHLVAADGGADTDVILEIGVTQGTSAASPSVPSVPTGALALMKVTVPSGTLATSGLTFTRMHEWVGGRAVRQPMCRLKASATTSIPNAAKTTVTLATTDVNDDTLLYSVSGSVITVLQAGRYDIAGRGHFGMGTDAQQAGFDITKNGTTFVLASDQAFHGDYTGATPVALGVTLAANDTIRLVGYQNTGSAQNMYHDVALNLVADLMIRKVA
jgi:hypothetical protein